MNKKQLLALVVVVALGAWFAVPAMTARPPAPGDRHEAGEAAHDAPEAAKGPHGGRLLTDGPFGVEVTIFERGVPPEFRAFLYENLKPQPPESARLTVRLHRLAGRTDTIGFAPAGDYLRGDKEVEEPHSFDVEVVADRGGNTSRWQYDSYEGRTTLSPEAVRSSGVAAEPAGPATIKRLLKVYGQVAPNGERTVQVAPRYPGVLKEAKKQLGDPVGRGEVVAVVESNESLQGFELRSPVAGTVVEKHLTAGAFVKEGEPVYLVSDLGTVWVDLNIPRQDSGRVRVGQTVTVVRQEGEAGATGSISYVSPVGTGPTQTLTARVVLKNDTGGWHPGLFVTATVLLEEAAVPLAVKVSALQAFRDWDVVFLRDGNAFEVRPLELGRRDSTWVEVLSGIEPGQEYVTENSFLIKADIGKSGATHDH